MNGPLAWPVSGLDMGGDKKEHVLLVLRACMCVCGMHVYLYVHTYACTLKATIGVHLMLLLINFLMHK